MLLSCFSKYFYRTEAFAQTKDEHPNNSRPARKSLKANDIVVNQHKSRPVARSTNQTVKYLGLKGPQLARVTAGLLHDQRCCPLEWLRAGQNANRPRSEGGSCQVKCKSHAKDSSVCAPTDCTELQHKLVLSAHTKVQCWCAITPSWAHLMAPRTPGGTTLPAGCQAAGTRTGEGSFLEVADGLRHASAGHVDLPLPAVRLHLRRRPRRHRRVLVVEVPAVERRQPAHQLQG